MKYLFILMGLLIVIVIVMSLDVIDRIVQFIGRSTGNEDVTLWGADPKNLLTIITAVIALVLISIFYKRK